MKEIIENIAQKNFALLDQLVQINSTDSVPQIAESVYIFCKKLGIEIDLIKWEIQREIQQTRESNILFREDSFVLYLINKTFFDDLGMKYLRFLLDPVIKRVIQLPNALEVSSRIPEEKSKNIKVILQIIEEFFESFFKSKYVCPVTFREIFCYTQKLMNNQYKERTPIISDFIFFHFICPVLVNPQKFELVENLSETCLISLLNLAKITKDVALNAKERWEENIEITKFIEKLHPLIIEHVNLLLNEKDLEQCKTILESSVIKKNLSKEEIQKEKTILFENLKHLKETEEQGPQIESISLEKFQIEKNKFIQKRDNPNWKKEKETKVTKLYFLRDEFESVNAVKLETDYNAELQKIIDTISEFQYSTKVASHYLTHKVVKEFCLGNMKYTEIYWTFKLPFPFSNRDNFLNQFEIHSESNHAFLVSENGTYPPQKGYIRTKWETSGWEIIGQNNKPNKCKVIYIAHVDFRGSIPFWVVNHLSSNIVAKVLNLKKICEST